MTSQEKQRLVELRALSGAELKDHQDLLAEKKDLESLRREEPIVLQGETSFHIDWFRDDKSGGARFKTWAGQQSVIDIATDMHHGLTLIPSLSEESIWTSVSAIGLPFNFDSDLGAQGSPLDIGFSFDPLSTSKASRIEGSCKPALEFLSFVGLQRFRPRETEGAKRFVYAVWDRPLPCSVAAAVVCQAIPFPAPTLYEFRLLYRTKYLKSFLPAQPFQGERDE